MCNPNTTRTSNVVNFTTDCTASHTTFHQQVTKKHQQPVVLNLLSLPDPINRKFQESSARTEQEEPPPTVVKIVKEAKSLFNLALPIALTALILYSRSILSMLFLGRLGDLELAGGSLAIAFANITGYSVLSGLALGMEPLCSQAFGAQRHTLLSLTLHRSIIFLLFCSIPITLLWLNMSKLLVVFLHQDPAITELAHTYLLFTFPDLITNSFVHPIRIYLRVQGITLPLTIASLIATILHVPLNFLLIDYFGLGVAGVALSASISNATVFVLLLCYMTMTTLHAFAFTKECFMGWKPLVRLAAPSCVSVCLEWWWYEIMIVFCGLLLNPKATVASMGILIQTTSLIYIFPSSLGFSVSTRVGNELGANRPNRAKLLAEVAIFIAALMGICASMFAIVMRNKWGIMFTEDESILRLTSTVLPILGLCELGNCPQTVGCGVVRGTARPSTAANVNMGGFYLVGMPVAVGLGFCFGFGFRGLWVGLLSAQVCCAGLMLYVVGTTDWDLQAKRAQLLTCTTGRNGCINGAVGGGGEGSFVEEEKRLICIVAT